MPNESYPVDCKVCATCQFWAGPRSPKMPFLDRVECNWQDIGQCFSRESGWFGRESQANCSGLNCRGWRQQFFKK